MTKNEKNAIVDYVRFLLIEYQFSRFYDKLSNEEKIKINNLMIDMLVDLQNTLNMEIPCDSIGDFNHSSKGNPNDC